MCPNWSTFTASDKLRVMNVRNSFTALVESFDKTSDWLDAIDLSNLDIYAMGLLVRAVWISTIRRSMFTNSSLTSWYLASHRTLS